MRNQASCSCLRLACLALLALAATTTGACSQNSGGSGRPPRTVFSSEEFNQGREDGRRDAELSLFDAHAAWTWLWMMSEDYNKGYEQGWEEVRTMKRLKAEQEEARRRHEEDQQRQDSQQTDAAG